MRPVSKKRQQRDRNYPAARMQVFNRAEGRCEACATDPDPRCSGRVEQVHHRAGRGGSDPHRLDNLLGVSAWHHTWIHANPSLSYERGWSVKRNRGEAA